MSLPQTFAREAVTAAIADILSPPLRHSHRSGDSSLTDGRLGFGLNSLPGLAGLAVLAASILVMVGWQLEIISLRHMFVAGVSMKANTAAALGLSAFSLLLLYRCSRNNRATPNAARALGVLVSFIGVATLLEYATGANLGIDQLLADASAEISESTFPGRMAAVTALESALMGIALLLFDYETRRFFRPAEPIALAAAAIAMMSVLGYVYGGIPAAGAGHSVQIAIPTAISFLALSLGFLALRVESGLMKALLSDRAGGILARRLLPFVFVVPLCLGFLRMFGGWVTDYSVATTTSVVAVLTMAAFAAITVGAARALNEADHRRAEADAERRALSVQRSQAMVADHARREEASRLVAQEQLKAKDQVLSHVSHELRTPLAAAHQFVGILLDGIAGDLNPEQREYLEIVLRNQRQLQAMIGDLLEATRARGGKLAIDAFPMEVEGIVNDLFLILRSPASEKGITLEMLCDDVPLAWADPTRVRQILTNLFENAVKFMSEGSIVVRASLYQMDPRFVCVTVADTGPGIPPESVERIFDRLYQVEGDLEAGRNGLGLGLYICRELAVRMGGKLWVESEFGMGSTFHLLLPVFADQEAARPVLQV